MNRARELYAATFGPAHLWYNRILAGECDNAPNMRPFIEQAERDALRDLPEGVEE